MDYLKINDGNEVKNYLVWKHPNETTFFVDLTDETKLPIEKIKAELEEKFQVKIKCVAECGYKRYAKDNYRDSNEFSYYFSTVDKA